MACSGDCPEAAPPPAAAKPRVRRRRATRRPPSTLWDSHALASLLGDYGAKTSHLNALRRGALRTLRELAARHASAEGGQTLATPLAWSCLDAATLVRKGDQLPTKLIEALPEALCLGTTKVVEAPTSADGATTKLLVELHDGHRIETVIMRHAKRTTVCVSSQIGCQMGCTFCATGTMGIIGDLSEGEILEQLLHADLIEAAAGRPRVRNVVFMGMGEPLNNYKSVSGAVRGMTDENLFGLRRAHVTVSTVGVVPYMRKLTDEHPGVNLALSLHAPTQKGREEIIPTATAYPLPTLVAALEYHLSKCKRSSNTHAVMI